MQHDACLALLGIHSYLRHDPIDLLPAEWLTRSTDRNLITFPTTPTPHINYPFLLQNKEATHHGSSISNHEEQYLKLNLPVSRWIPIEELLAADNQV